MPPKSIRPAAPRVPPCPGGIAVDFSHWPLVVMTPPPNALSDADFMAYIKWMEQYVTRAGVKYAVVNDARRAAPITAAHRKLLSDYMTRVRPITRIYCVGMAMVFDSAVMRGIMTAILWMTDPDYPTRVFATPAEAIAWAEVQLGRAAHELGAQPRSSL